MLRFLLPLALTLTCCAFAQPAQLWTLQTAAFGSAEQAAAAVGQLRAGGFDAYGERSEGLTRVRVGCFLDRASAEDVALNLAQREVQVVPLNPGARVSFCIRREAGFFLPAAWGVAQRTPESITFWVDAAGRRYLRFDRRGWQVYQDAPAALASEPSVSAASERATRAPLRVNSLLVGSGQLLWRSEGTRQTLVVRGEASIFTLTLIPPGDLASESAE